MNLVLVNIPKPKRASLTHGRKVAKKRGLSLSEMLEAEIFLAWNNHEQTNHA